jgi:hypothetical protein
MIVQIYEIRMPWRMKSASNWDGTYWRRYPGAERMERPVLREIVRVSHGMGTKNSLIPLFHDMDTTLEYYEQILFISAIRLRIPTLWLRSCLDSFDDRGI